MKNKRILSMLLVLILVISYIIPIAPVNATTKKLVSWDFEDGTSQSWVLGWGGVFAGTQNDVSYSEDLKTEGNVGALKIELSLASGGWKDGAIKVPLAEGGVDSSTVNKVEFDVYIPNAPEELKSIKPQVAFNDPSWAQGGDGYIGVATLEKVVINNVEYSKKHIEMTLDVAGDGTSKEFIIKLGNDESTYTGAIYLDNIVLGIESIKDSNTDSTSDDNVPTKDSIWNFENIENPLAWSIGWGTGFLGGDKDVSYSEDLKREGNNGSLKVQVKLNLSSWTEANVQAYLMDKDMEINTSKYKKLYYDIYVPNPDSFGNGLKLAEAFNDTWGPIKDWEDVDLKNVEKVTINNVTYGVVHRNIDVQVANVHKKLTLRISSYGSNYTGPRYIDDVRVSPFTDKLSVDILSPNKLEVAN
ncbi:hypothetical protein [Clostridium grantii]|uniref:Carbohydrate binding module 27 n=1 Tax=Clostridium grantii DSM 8605 TaxID=1121316 RepID=A0A1M5UAT7_9CLOT|nr:hypothetical protein [Clostridium grantii]SHH60087.1 Carbohydrate binding module 27 [Clostridium grantii DSM 8605]